MSDKHYSTDDLIDLMENRKSTCLNPITKMKYDAIIHKLRAADALLSAAKKVHVAVQVYADPNDYAEFKKAIAAYEGKED
jgi:AICAR transformylase/IMP cyclohydrolase PurH